MRIYELHANLQIQRHNSAVFYSHHSRPNSRNSHRVRGFSLIETLVAVVILVSAVVGPLTLAQRSIRSAVYARDQVTASFLAEEAIEYIRSVRDGNEHNRNNNWLKGLSQCIGKLCMVDATQDTDNAFKKCDNKKPEPYGSSCYFLAFEGARGGRYGFKTLNWEDTRFVREVTIATIPRGDNTSDKEAKVEVKVRWQTGNLPVRDIVMREYIYDW
ncbi:MAG: Uncharacterized protein G01um101417_348 [Parcubacteria group bacterium Gr01-1014_17]|nr:MAG: Uncharacterized protein G01um101417_348 [Parcubacteria group bacterium Gr01-1014_17]